MKLLYLHGLASSKDSNTAKIISDYFIDDEVLAIDIESNPREAIIQIFNTIQEFNPNIIVGTSLGGFYASLFGGPIKVLINPALKPDEEIIKVLKTYGEHEYLKKRKEKTFTYTESDEEMFRKIRKTFLDYILDNEFIYETFAVFGNEDEVVQDKDYFIDNYGKENVIEINAQHRLTDENIKNDIIPLISKIKYLCC